MQHNGKNQLKVVDLKLAIGIVPLTVFAILIVYLAISNPFSDSIYNPPNLLLTLNTIFVTGTGITVAIISAISYLRSGRSNLLLLGSGALAGGLASLIGGLTANILANYGVTTHNSGMLLASLLQVASAVITLLYVSPNKAKRKIFLSLGYLVIISFFLTLTWLTLNNHMPLFFSPSGPTALRQTILGLSIISFSVSSALFFLQYMRSKSRGLYWYSIALALFAIGMIGIVFQQRNADIFVWIGRAAQYAGGFYFIVALLTLRSMPEKGIPLAERWVGIFSADRRQLSTFFSKLSEGFIYGRIVTNSKGQPVDFVYLDANDAYENMRGITKEDLLGKKATEVFSRLNEDPSTLTQRYGEVALTGKPASFERYVQAFDKWYNISSYCPQTDYFIAILEDITKRKKAEEALQKRTNELETAQKKLQEYANQMEKLAQERADQLKEAERMVTIGQTAGMVGHDIRNPLQAILGDLFLLQEDYEKIQDKQSRESAIKTIENIDENIAYINKIIADLQDYARNTQPSYFQIDMAEIINKTFSSINIPENIEKEIYVEPNTKIKTDPSYIRRIITNLTTNAIQAMPNGGKLTIKVTQKKSSIEITVADNGEGVLEDNKDKMFKPLFTTKSKGQGFGLAVVKKFVEQLGGTITYQSQQGKGTTFKIELPSQQ